MPDSFIDLIIAENPEDPEDENLLLESRAAQSTQFTPASVDYLTISLPALPEFYSIPVILSGTAAFGTDYLLFKSASTGYCTVDVYDWCFYHYGGSGGMDVYLVPINDSEARTTDLVATISLGELVEPDSGGGDAPTFVPGNPSVSVKIVDDDCLKINVSAVDAVASERLPGVAQDYGYYEFSRVQDGDIPGDVSYSISISFDVYVSTTDQFYCPELDVDYRLRATPVDENDNAQYLADFNENGQSPASTREDGSSFYYYHYTAKIPAGKMSARLRLEPIYDWLDEGSHYSLLGSPDAQLGEFVRTKIVNVSWGGMGNWNGVGSQKEADVEIKDGAILALYFDYNHNDSLYDTFDVDSSINNTPCKIDYNDDDDNNNTTHDRLEGVGENVPPDYAGVENENDLYKAKLYAWVADLTGLNGQNYIFDVQLQNSPLSSVSGITLWNESNKRTLFVQNFNPKHIDNITTSQKTVEQIFWLEGVNPQRNNLSLGAICYKINSTGGESVRVQQYDRSTSTLAYVSNFTIDIDVDSDNNGYINSNGNASDISREDDLETIEGKPITFFPQSISGVTDDYRFVDLQIRNIELENNVSTNIFYSFQFTSNLAVCTGNGSDPPPIVYDDKKLVSNLDNLNYRVKAISGYRKEGMVHCFLWKYDPGTSTYTEVARDTVLFEIQDGSKTNDWLVPSGWTIEGVNAFTTPMPVAGAVGPKTEGTGVITNDGNAITKQSYPDGFILEFDYLFERNTTPGYAQGYLMADNKPTYEIINSQDDQKMGFFGNSGVKIFGIYEIQLFDVNALLNMLGQDLSVNQSGRIVDANGYIGDNVGTFISGIPYDSPNKTITDLNLASLLQSSRNRVIINVTRVSNDYTVSVSVNDCVTLPEQVITNGTGSNVGVTVASLSDPQKKIQIQSHWGSGVKFENVRITDKGNQQSPTP